MKLDAEALEKAYAKAAKCSPDLPEHAREIMMSYLRVQARAAIEKATTPAQLRAAIAAMIKEAG